MRPDVRGAVTLTATASGFYFQNGTFTSQGNYAVGWFPSPANPPRGTARLPCFRSHRHHRDHTGDVTSSGFSRLDASVTWTLFDLPIWEAERRMAPPLSVLRV